MLLAYGAARALAAVAPFAVVRSAGLGVDGGVLVFTLLVSLATSLLFGLVPALQASRVDLTEAIKRGGAPSVTGGRMVRTRGLLVVSEIALAVMLLTGAGLLTKSLVSLYNVDLGYRADNVLVMKATGVRTLAENNAFFTEVMGRIASLPGITAVGATSIPPGQLADAGSGAYFIDRKPEVRDRATEPEALFTIVAPGAFSALGVPLKSGRDFEAGDLPDGPLVAIVNEALVRRSLAGQNPIGRTIYCSFDRSNDPMTIVGVVGDARQRNPALEPMPECYMPYRQHSYNNATLHVVMRTVGDPASHAAAVRQAAADVSPNVPVSFATLESMTQNGVAEPRFRSLLFALFAGLAVCLAMAGVYGVVAYSVEQRAKEIGVRMAMGASGQSVLRMILRQGLVLGAAGVAIGLAGAAAATRLLESVLFQVQPLDVQVYVAVALLLGVVTLAAGFLPARRAARMDPMPLLKAD
jgi:predicted permease